MLRVTVLLALVCVAVAFNVLPAIRPLSGLSVSFSTELKSGSDFICKTCIQESVVIINEILNDGLQDVELGCKGVCSHVKSSKTLQQTCAIMCDAIGLVEYVKLIKTRDFDPIYLCEVVHACATGNCTGDCADILSEGVSPPNGDQKTVFHAGFVMEIKQNITATGMLRITFVDQNNPKDPGQSSDSLTQEIAVGNYNLNIELDAAEIGLGPASKKEGDTASYLLTVQLCEGECGSSHPWSRILAANSSQFNVTKTK